MASRANHAARPQRNGTGMKKSELLREIELALDWKEGSIDDRNPELASFDLNSMSAVLLLLYFDRVGLSVESDALARCRSVSEILKLVGRENFQD